MTSDLASATLARLEKKLQAVNKPFSTLHAFIPKVNIDCPLGKYLAKL